MTSLIYQQPPLMNGKFVDILNIVDELLKKYGQNNIEDSSTKEKLGLMRKDFERLLNELNKLVKIFAESNMDIDKFFFLYSHRIQSVLISLYIMIEEILNLISRIEKKSPEEILKESIPQMYLWKDETIKKLAKVYEGIFRNNLLDYLSNKTLSKEEIYLFNKLNFISLGWIAILDGKIHLKLELQEKIRRYLEDTIEQIIEFWSDIYMAKKMDESMKDDFVDKEKILSLLSNED